MISRAQFFRFCRLLHGWLSAAAFLVLLFFAATGVLLNHPEWLSAQTSRTVDSSFPLSAEEEGRLSASADAPRTLAEIAAAHAPLIGAFKSGDVDRWMLYVRMEGAKGASNLRADREQHRVEVSVERVGVVPLLNELHRAEHAGPAWRLIVDLVAAVLIATSIIGYIIFLSLRFQLRTAFFITAASGLLLLAAVLLLAV